MQKVFIASISIVILILIGAGVYWYVNKDIVSQLPATTEGETRDPFVPLNRNGITAENPNTPTNQNENTEPTTPSNNASFKMPKLRQLSNTPVAGMYASTTKIRDLNFSSTTIEKTIVRFVDRGTGHIYEANDSDLNIEKLSNTTLPKIYEAFWNKNLTAMVVRYLKDNTDMITNFYAEVRSNPNSTASSTTSFEVKGKYLSPNINQVAVSPEGNRIFTWNIENDSGVGYLSSFDEKGKTKIIDTPLTQMNIDWPATSTVTLTTRGSGFSLGYMYAINTKNASTRKLFGGIRGISAKMSRDGKNVIYSTGGNNLTLGLFNTNKSEFTEVMFNTIADKCVWSSIRTNEAYCAVPNETPAGVYPDDWYKGKILFTDKIWHLDTTTGEVHLLANLLDLSNKLIDATELVLDPKENYLYFINKRDLTLWALDLNQ
jgi:hypothetical protein